MKILLYTKTGCPWCAEVMDFLNKEHIPYEEREVLGNKANFEELVKKSNQTKTPTLDIDGEIIADSDAPAVRAYLAAKGALKRSSL